MDGRGLECTAAEKALGAFVEEDDKLKFEQRERQRKKKKKKKIAGMVTCYIQYKKKNTKKLWYHFLNAWFDQSYGNVVWTPYLKRRQGAKLLDSQRRFHARSRDLRGGRWSWTFNLVQRDHE